MSKLRRLAAFAAVAPLLGGGPAPALAQEAGGQTEYVFVQKFQVAPGHAAKFLEAAQMVVRAAEQADLAARYGWALYRDSFDFYLVEWPESMAYFDDPEQWMRQFEGTPGHETLMGAFGMFEEVDVSSTSWVEATVPEWSYMPEDPAVGPRDYQGVYVVQDWVKFGHQQAFAENTRAIIGLLGEIGYPYPVFGHRGVIGEGGQVTFVIVHDGLDRFYGENSVERLLAAAGKQEEWGRLMEARSPMLLKAASFTAAYLPEHSYEPATEAGAMGGGN